MVKGSMDVSLRGTKEIPSLCSEQAAQSHIINCHCEEQSDVAISLYQKGIASPLRGSQ
jgi:hypothetical protein